MFITLTFILSLERIHSDGGEHKVSCLCSLDPSLIGRAQDKMKLQDSLPNYTQNPVALACLWTVEIMFQEGLNGNYTLIPLQLLVQKSLYCVRPFYYHKFGIKICKTQHFHNWNRNLKCLMLWNGGVVTHEIFPLLLSLLFLLSEFSQFTDLSIGFEIL